MPHSMHKFSHWALLPVLLTLISAHQFFGQGTSGRLHGRVVDATGALVPGARVSVKRATEQVATVNSDAVGNYQIEGLPPGTYTIVASAKGFAEFTRMVTLSAGQDVKLEIVLAVGAQQLEIVVQGKEGDDEGHGRSVGVGSESNANATIITSKELDYLPDDPTELGIALLELAGPGAGPNGGQVYVDGFASGYLPAKISIREIRINQNPFAAEQDKLGMNRIEVFTKPGGNQFHGQILFHENNSVFNSRNPFVPKLPFNSTIFMGDFFGPISKKATGYLSFQRRSIHDTTPVSAIVLDPNLNPVPFSQTLAHPNYVNVGASRVDYQLTPNHTVIARYSYTGINEKGGGIANLDLASQAANYRSYEHRVQISENMRINSRAENDIRFEFKKSYDAQLAVDSSPEINVLGAFGGGGNPIGHTTFTQEYYELQNHTLMSRGQHTIKFGGRLRADVFDYASTEFFNGFFSFGSLDEYRITLQGLQQGLTPAQIRAAGGGADSFIINRGQPRITFTAADAGLYVQDDWRIRPNLNLGYGLRFESQNVIHDQFDFAPRLSLAWGIDADKKGAAKTILRTGVGVFYDRFATPLEGFAKLFDGNHVQQFNFPKPDFFPNIPSVGAAAATQLAPAAASSISPREEHGGAVPTIYQISPDFKGPYTIEASVGLERQVRKSATLSLTYIYSRGVRQPLSRNINAPLPGTFTPGNPISGIRPLGELLNVYQYQSTGYYRQNQLIAGVNLRTTSHISIVARYTLGYADSTVSIPGTNIVTNTTFPADQYDPRADYGRAAFDIRHRISVGSVLDLPKGFRVSPFFLLRSGVPFDITMPGDLNGDSIFNDRPAFATDLSRPSVVVTRFGAFDTDPIPGQKIIPRNFARGPVEYVLNLRLSKSVALGPKTGLRNTGAGKQAGSAPPVKQGVWNPYYKVTFSVVAQNVFNHLNPGPPIGILDSPIFGQSNTLAPGPFSSTSASRRVIFSTLLTF